MHDEQGRTPEEIARERAEIRKGVDNFLRRRYGGTTGASPLQSAAEGDGEPPTGPEMARAFMDRKYGGPTTTK